MSTPNPRHWAQRGNQGVCTRCGRKVKFDIVGYTAVTNKPIYRWVGVRYFKRAPIPTQCVSKTGSRGLHRIATHDEGGKPVGQQAGGPVLP